VANKCQNLELNCISTRSIDNWGIEVNEIYCKQYN